MARMVWATGLRRWAFPSVTEPVEVPVTEPVEVISGATRLRVRLRDARCEKSHLFGVISPFLGTFRGSNVGGHP